MKIYQPYDILNFGKYKGEKLDFVFMFHPEYVEWLINNSDFFAIDIKKFEALHTFPFAQQYCSDSKYYNSITVFVDGEQRECSLKEYLTEFIDLYENQYLKIPEKKKHHVFSAKVIERNNEKIR
ncbi:MAG: hypothetical protein K0S26_1092 [Bacteroidota bacterium]|jgi:hypothetical protein|nr:hypothetical protein [Bacteroidota bacterium]